MGATCTDTKPTQPKTLRNNAGERTTTKHSKATLGYQQQHWDGFTVHVTTATELHGSTDGAGWPGAYTNRNTSQK